MVLQDRYMPTVEGRCSSGGHIARSIEWAGMLGHWGERMLYIRLIGLATSQATWPAGPHADPPRGRACAASPNGACAVRNDVPHAARHGSAHARSRLGAHAPPGPHQLFFQACAASTPSSAFDCEHVPPSSHERRAHRGACVTAELNPPFPDGAPAVPRARAGPSPHRPPGGCARRGRYRADGA